ncbi:L-type lectin-domain containing receptor kinase IX.1-like [Cynara cardunculus var. scolymus]|uniref:non-specific serine/threonine protein kinase n=1 Tax=Cynara cardunculus var. scolymus TaxID=59895 RepID=A0A103YKQ0_CYNCS|nr:L-type lectin-domain containing receptor kinase IX.1-like [Cynara cardunculus var. scolymus]KVI10869.1 Concanavalin A-like lectin/glucanase superfamily [Cynara cardunculus var. scolymus]
MLVCNSRNNNFHHLCSPTIIILISLFQILPSLADLTFNLTSFNPNNHDLNYYGDATPSSPDIQLTRNQRDKEMHYSTGRITYPKLLQLWDKDSGEVADFTTRFSFTVDSWNQSHYGDGIAFFLAPEGFQTPQKQEGGGIGLVSGDQVLNSTSNPFIAVEFDTYKNDWDPVGDHVGININSMVSVTNVSWLNDVSSGKMNGARVSYNSSAKRLSVAFTGFDQGGFVFNQRLSTEVDLRNYLPERVCIGFSASTGDFFEIHTLHSWDFESRLSNEEKIIGSQINANGPTPGPSVRETITAPGHAVRQKVVLGVCLGLGLTVCAVISWFFMLGSLKKRKAAFRKKDEDELGSTQEFEIETGPKKFSYKVLALATKNFSEGEKIGQGGFGGVYKGFLRRTNSYVAVKKISSGSKQGIREYAAEVKTISRLRHRNLVQLIGWCHEGKELLLVYEFMLNGSLDSHLFKGSCFLTWAMRYNVARGLASALLYLHEEWEQCVLHRDIKSSNVMLDSNFNAKLGDFGLARLVDHGKGSQTTILAGTMGYVAPECVLTGKAGKVSDVYSFGVVALEIVTGKKPIGPTAEDGHIRLVDHVWDLYGKGKLSQAADSKLGADFDEAEMERLITVGLWCAHPDPNIRPTIKQAIQVLNFEAPVPNLPKTVPVATFAATPITMSAFWSSPSFELTGFGRDYTMCSGSSNDATLSKLTTSSSASSSASIVCNTL